MDFDFEALYYEKKSLPDSPEKNLILYILRKADGLFRYKKELILKKENQEQLRILELTNLFVTEALKYNKPNHKHSENELADLSLRFKIFLIEAENVILQESPRYNHYELINPSIKLLEHFYPTTDKSPA